MPWAKRDQKVSKIFKRPTNVVLHSRCHVRKYIIPYSLYDLETFFYPNNSIIFFALLKGIEENIEGKIQRRIKSYWPFRITFFDDFLINIFFTSKKYFHSFISSTTIKNELQKKVVFGIFF